VGPRNHVLDRRESYNTIQYNEYFSSAVMSTLGGYRGAWGGYVTSLESKAVGNSAVFSLDLKMAKLSLWRT